MAPAVRIVSLLPAATEIVAALGIADRLVGRSHECDEPPALAGLPALTAARIDAEGSSRAIHEQVTTAPAALFALDVPRLAALAPDLILTQAACDVCAVAADEVAEAVRTSGVAARVLALAPTSLDDVFADVLAVGAATGRAPQARELVARLRARCAAVRFRVAARGAAAASPTVALIEWLDPPMAAGNWVPELVRLAGGRDVLGRSGAHSHWIGWDDVERADPDVLVLVPCGFTLDRVVAEARSAAVWPRLAGLRAVAAGRAWAVDGHHLFNRPGPRLVDSLEVLAQILHPGAFAFSAAERFARRL